MSDKKRKLVAYHEAGHALVGALMPEYDPVTKISIVPRGAAGGLTFFAPSEERLESGLYSRTYFENQVGGGWGVACGCDGSSQQSQEHLTYTNCQRALASLPCCIVTCSTQLCR
jgi:hypothetical protein